MRIDFFTETSGPLVPNVTNKIYFQAWATDARADVYEFKAASLIAVDFNDAKTVLVNNLISTEHRGKGSFTFVHSTQYSKLYLSFTSTQNQVVERDLNLMQFTYLVKTSSPYIYNENDEITFSVDSKIIPANE